MLEFLYNDFLVIYFVNLLINLKDFICVYVIVILFICICYWIYIKYELLM